MRRIHAMCVHAVCAGLAIGALAGPLWAQSSVTVGPTLTEEVRAKLNIETLRVVKGQRGGYVPRSDCPQLMSNTAASFEGGAYVIQAGFSQNEVAAASFTVPADQWPLQIKQLEMIFATQNAQVPTVTEYSILVWDGYPNNGTLVAEFSSDDVILPHLRMNPGTNGTNLQIQIDPTDPEQIFVFNTSGQNVFTIGYRIDRHNQQTGNPCLTAPPAQFNAFPVTDNDGLQRASMNWLFGLNCGSFGCPPNGGWTRFSTLNALCRPSGDWVMRATYDPVNCPGATGACCLTNGNCLVLTAADCGVVGGSWAGANTPCTDFNGNGTADACERPSCPADWDGSGGIDGDDIPAFFADWQQGNADIDGSGGTDGDDITFFFVRWEGGC